MSTPTLAPPTVRELLPDEWSRLQAHEPFASQPLPDPAHWRILVAEANHDIVAFLCLHAAVHLEPFWIHADYRHRPKLFLDLWHQARDLLTANDVGVVFAVADDSLGPAAGRFLDHLGFVPSEGRLFIVPVTSLLGGR